VLRTRCGSDVTKYLSKVGISHPERLKTVAFTTAITIFVHFALSPRSRRWALRWGRSFLEMGMFASASVAFGAIVMTRGFRDESATDSSPPSPALTPNALGLGSLTPSSSSSSLFSRSLWSRLSAWIPSPSAFVRNRKLIVSLAAIALWLWYLRRFPGRRRTLFRPLE
jgi:hypothetical protein